MSRIRKLPPRTVWLVIAGVGAFLNSATYAITGIYFVNEVGMSPLELILVGTAMESAAFLFEIPTGIVADVYSRRISVIIGFVLSGATIMCVGLIPSFPAIAIAYFVGGFAYTFISGALDAWLADEIGPANLGPAYFSAQQLRYLGALTGIGAGTALATIALPIPIVAGGVGNVLLGIFLVLFMPESGFRSTPAAERESWRAMRETLQDGVGQVRGHPVLLVLLAVAGFMGMYSEGVDRLVEAHFLTNFRFPILADLQPVVWLGLVRAASLVLAIGGTRLARRLVDPSSPAQASRALFVITGLEIGGTVAFALAGEFAMAVAFLWLAAVARSSAGPIYRTWLNQSLDSRSRATVLSMSGQMDALGQISGGPVVGLIGNRLSIRAALVTSGLVLSPALWLYARARTNARDEGEDEGEG